MKRFRSQGRRGLSAGVILAAAGLARAQALVERFDDASSLEAQGWLITNNSQPVGPQSWFQGVNTSFPPHASTGYVAANYQNVTNFGTISTWLVMPERMLADGDELRFWTRTIDPPAYADRLQVRLSTAGAATGPGATDVGDFTTLLLDINPEYRLSGQNSFPNEWTEYSIVLSGLGVPTPGRLAFRYFVENGGVNGAYSDYVGLDTLEFAPGGVALGQCCNPATGSCAVVSALMCESTGGVFAGAGTNCDGNPCTPPVTGACCRVNGTCVVEPMSACIAAGGAYRGDGSACTGQVCPLRFPYTGEFIIVPDGEGSASCGPAALAEIFVPLSFAIQEVEVAITMRHTWQGDVIMRLSRANGPTVELIRRPGYPQSSFGFSASDFGLHGASSFRITEAGANTYDVPTVVFPGVDQVSGSWKSEGPLESFSGINSAGMWKLEVFDCAGGEGGELQDFVLFLTPAAGQDPCYANCDGSTGAPLLSANDFQCFLNLYANSDSRANCDASTNLPLLTANDFSCFLSRFNSGCS